MMETPLAAVASSNKTPLLRYRNTNLTIVPNGRHGICGNRFSLFLDFKKRVKNEGGSSGSCGILI